MKKISAFVLALLVLTGIPLYAQNKGALTITCNVIGAQVYINGKIAGTTTPNFSMLLKAGTYQIRVSKKGLPDFNTTINMNGLPVTLNVVLGGAAPTPVPQPVPVPAPQPVPQPQHTLTIHSNVNGADVLINGSLAGHTPYQAQINDGSYTIIVRAAGYSEYNANLSIRGNTTVNANLQAMNFVLNVNATNVQGAEVILNGQSIGRTPFTGSLQPGVYNLTLRMPGYSDYNVQVNMNGPQTVSAYLQPQMASWQINGYNSQIQFYIDGQPVRNSQGQFAAGRHSIRIVIGSLATETTIDAQAGRNYSIQPVLGVNVN